MDVEMKPVDVEVTEDEPCMALDDPEFMKSLPHSYRQQHSVGSRARQRWGQIKRTVDDKGLAKKEVAEKWVNLTRSMSSGVSGFFGVSEATDTEKWKARSRRLHNNSFLGGPKKGLQSAEGSQMFSPPTSYLTVSGDHVDHTDPMAPPKWNRKTPQPIDPLSRMQSRQFSRISTMSASRRGQRLQPSRHSQKDSVLKMTMDGVKYLAQGMMTPTPKTFVRSRSFAPSLRQTPLGADEQFLDDVFFDQPAPTSAAIQMKPFFGNLPHIRENSESDQLEPLAESASDGVFNSLDSIDGMSPRVWLNEKSLPMPFTKPEQLKEFKEAKEAQKEKESSRVFAGMSRVADRLVDATFVNSERRQYGVGVVGVWLDRDYRQSRIDSRVEKQMEEMDDHRPYFTYWVTFVQIVIFLFTICVYGITKFGFEEQEVQGEVPLTNLAIEQCHYFEPQNMWVGPRQADLIHLGAKYSPCMRDDANVAAELRKARDADRNTACCINNDGSGCFQASERECSKTLSTWLKINTSATVCGLDRRYCFRPPSIDITTWSKDDITLWPICLNNTKREDVKKSDENRHMTCDVTGRPCCVGIKGQCIITTPKHCEFLHGYFHEEAALCSQVACLNDVCGMIPFYNATHPDQFYRLWTSLFLHAGLIQLLITVSFQIVIMRDLEKLAGWIRICIIYILSGIAGSLSSAIFLPYHVEAGPTGSQFGLLACLFVEVIQSWQILEHPLRAVGKLMILLVFLFAVGLFPWIDNYAHLVGFIFGFLLAFALFPHVTFNVVDKRGKRIGVAVCLIASVGLFIGLIILFYVTPIYKCEFCKYFNCIPLTDTFCSSMEVKIVFNNDDNFCKF